MKFKQFLKETEGVQEQDPNVTNIISDIKNILVTMDSDEIDDFGAWLYDSIYSYDTGSQDDYNDDDYDDDNSFTLDEIMEMLVNLDSDDLQFVFDNISFNPSDGDGYVEDDYDDPDKITEKKFFKKRKIQLNKEKKKNRAQRRKDKRLRHLEYKKHKSKIKIKHKKYLRKVKRNPNLVRHHR